MEIAIQNERSSFPPIINYTVVYCGPELLRKKSHAKKTSHPCHPCCAKSLWGWRGSPFQGKLPRADITKSERGPGNDMLFDHLPSKARPQPNFEESKLFQPIQAMPLSTILVRHYPLPRTQANNRKHYVAYIFKINERMANKNHQPPAF